MRVHSVKHGRHRTCRVSVSALFVMTSFFSCSVSLRCVLCALSPLARFPSFVLCPAWYAGCFGARGVGRAHLARSAVLSPREDVCYRVSPFVFASCFYTRTQMQKVCPTHAKCGCSIIFRLCLTNLALIVYPCYTLTIPLHLRSDYFFVAFDKFIVADESIDGYNESADKVKN